MVLNGAVDSFLNACPRRDGTIIERSQNQESQFTGTGRFSCRTAVSASELLTKDWDLCPDLRGTCFVLEASFYCLGTRMTPVEEHEKVEAV